MGYGHACPPTRTGVGFTHPVAGVPGGPWPEHAVSTRWSCEMLSGAEGSPGSV